METTLETLKRKENETDCQWAYRLLDGIPEDKFIKNSFTNGLDKCCSEGHLRRLTSNKPNSFRYDDWLHSYGLAYKLHWIFVKEFKISLIGINDTALNIKNEVLKKLQILIDKKY